MKKGGCFLVAFLFFWTALVGLFDVVIARNFLRQMRTRSYVEGVGRILSSEVTEHRGSDDTTYRARVRYEYQVDGQRYESEVVRPGDMGDSEGRLARDTVRANPAGLDRTVYYNPDQPGESVLERGISDQLIFMTVFLTPFNAVIVFLFEMLRRMRGPMPVAGGAKIRAVGGQLQVNYQRFSRLTVAAGTIGAVAFVGIFLLAIVWKMAPPASASLSVWGVSAVLAAVIISRRDESSDLLIDAQQGVVSLRHRPLGTLSAWREWKREGRPRLGLPFERITGVEVRERISTSSDGDTRSFVPVLVAKESPAGPPVEYDLGSWLSEEHASSFATWLRETLGLKGAPPRVT